MSAFNERRFILETPEYERQFWDVAKGRAKSISTLTKGADNTSGGYYLPEVSDKKLEKEIKQESVFRNLATVITAYEGPSHILATEYEDIAAWVPEGEGIPEYSEYEEYFDKYPIDARKLAVLMKLDSDFVHDATFNIEDNLTKRLGRAFAKAEDAAFLTGDGNGKPYGLLNANDSNRPECGVLTTGITFDNVIKLYYSLDPEFRKNAVWMMNDETALFLRFLRDEDGAYLWNHTNDTILGKPVVICNDMPSEERGSIPILFGDFSYYWIVLRKPVSVLTLKEKFFTSGQIGYLATELLDAKLIRGDAIHYLKIRDTEPVEMING